MFKTYENLCVLVRNYFYISSVRLQVFIGHIIFFFLISCSYNFLFNPNLCGWRCYEFSCHIFCWIIKSCAAFYAALHFKIFCQIESPTLSCPCLHLLKFLLYESRMSEFFYSLVKLMCFATMLLIMKLYVCWVSYSYIIPDLF